MSKGGKGGKVMLNCEEHVPLSEPRSLPLCKGPCTDDLSVEEFCSGHGRRETRLQHIACAVPLPLSQQEGTLNTKIMCTNLA